ncbi:MAG: aldehyde dehydrogenase family protein [Planctomycetota bacterium]|nr:aldehyde dehydrogenase family protein [Planctomycetota bacterium]
MTTTLIAGTWAETPLDRSTFRASNPTTGEAIERDFPISTWDDLEPMLAASVGAARALAETEPARIARMLRETADLLDADRRLIAETAHEETGLALEPRLLEVEFDRTVGQLRQAADAAEDVSVGSWRDPLRDPELDIYGDRGPLGGAVFCIGPNNFPLAYHAACGGDFAAAIAAGNPVIAKGHPLHPETGRLIARCAAEAVNRAGLHPATVQYFHHCEPEVGLRMVGDRRVAAIGFTGGRPAGLSLKAAADACGTPAYLEMSSVNPVFIGPGALASDAAGVAAAWSNSVQLGGGQFCTKPGIVVLIGADAEGFVDAAAQAMTDAEPSVLLSRAVVDGLVEGVQASTAAGAELLVGGRPADPGFRFESTLLSVEGRTFLSAHDVLSRERFGPLGLVVRADGLAEALEIAELTEGQLTSTICTGSGAADAEVWSVLSSVLRTRCGRLLQNKMPTGVAVVPPMVHGGPFPATGHPGFTAVGFPTSVARFTMRRCWDGVDRNHRPAWLQ